jgi:hypothetical protein
MAGARVIRGVVWSLSLLGLTCCAAEADVLSEDGLRGVQVVIEDAAVPQAMTDGGGAADASTTEQYFTSDGGKGPIWTGCDGTGGVLERGLTGDPCSFVSQCANVEPNCGQRTALCADGVLHTAQVSKNMCEEDDPLVSQRCAALVPDSCCIELWQCESSELRSENQPVVRVCALDCRNTKPAPSLTIFTNCPNDSDGVPWPDGSFPPALGARCEGDFICDSYGTSLGLASVPFVLDDYGRIYWCQHGIVQRVAMGKANYLPWNTPLLP